MKMSFKQWAMILAALEERARELSSSLEWCKPEDGSEPDEYKREQITRIMAELEPIQEIIRKIQAATL